MEITRIITEQEQTWALSWSWTNTKREKKTGVSTALHHLHVKWNHLILDDQSLAVPVIGDRKKYKFV
jgi:hypothetical protein